MSSKTKIVVLRMKEIIYTAIFVGLGILLITLFLIMFRPKKDTVPTSGEAAAYVPGVYSSAITLNNQDVNVEVTVDADKITSVTLVPLSEAVTTMYAAGHGHTLGADCKEPVHQKHLLFR